MTDQPNLKRLTIRNFLVRMSLGGSAGWLISTALLALPPALGGTIGVLLLGAVAVYIYRQFKWLRQVERELDDRLFDLEVQIMTSNYWNEDEDED